MLSVFAADAFARLTGLPGVAAVTAGPGVTNSITALKNAQMARTPLVLLGGATATILKGRGALQDIEQMALVRSAVKWTARCKTVGQIRTVCERALREAQSGVPGPVFIELPVDVLYPESVVTEWYMKETGVSSAKTLGQKALGLYLKGHLFRQFHAPGVDLSSLVPPRLSRPELRYRGRAVPAPDRCSRSSQYTTRPCQREQRSRRTRSRLLSG